MPTKHTCGWGRMGAPAAPERIVDPYGASIDFSLTPRWWLSTVVVSVTIVRCLHSPTESEVLIQRLREQKRLASTERTRSLRTSALGLRCYGNYQSNIDPSYSCRRARRLRRELILLQLDKIIWRHPLSSVSFT